MPFINCNINDQVRVKLTDFGRKVFVEDFKTTTGQSPSPVREDEEGWSSWQLWALIDTFGQYIRCDVAELPFSTDIQMLCSSSALENPID